MYPTTILEWYFQGQWRRIGWDAHTASSAAALKEHGRKMSLSGGWYRLVQPSAYRDAPPDVIHEYPNPAIIKENA